MLAVAVTLAWPSVPVTAGEPVRVAERPTPARRRRR